VAFPDVLLAINSAADSGLVREILAEADKRHPKKSLDSPEHGIAYAPPLLISVTSEADKDTGITWRRAQGLGRLISDMGGYNGQFTDGHDPQLQTHELMSLGIASQCNPKLGQGFGQDWHCLRFPEPRSQATPSFTVDLPTTSHRARGGPVHERYVMRPKHSGLEKLAWLMQIPPKLVEDHNDIFNPVSSLLFLALVQISGAVMSLAKDIEDNFEDA
jgi:hypothetical protein